MKAKFILLFMVVLGFFSCEKEIVIQDTPTFSKSEMTSTIDVHPSIISSDWWKSYAHPVQEMIAREISNAEKIVTIDDIMQGKALSSRNAQKIAYRAKVCPGFPMPNPEGNVTLNSQAEVNAFGALSCQMVTGELMISDTLGPDPICDLTPLRKIKSVGSAMSVYSDCLTSLDGLDNLKSIGELGPFGFIGVHGIHLTDIEALSNLKTVTGSIDIVNCNSLVSIENAFSKITDISSENTLNPITSNYLLYIAHNDVIEDISGFRNITYLEGGLYIYDNGVLTDLDDLTALHSIGRQIIVESNPLLENVNKLSVITSVSDLLFVAENPSLTSCCGLYHLLCANPPVCDVTGVGGDIYIMNNGSGCTISEIISGGPCL